MIDVRTALLGGIVLLAALSLNGVSPPWHNYLSALYTATTAWQRQGIYGTYYSGNIVPGACGADVVAELSGHYPVAERVVVTFSDGMVIDVPLNWTRVVCEYFGTYRVGLQPGNYSVDILSCTLQPHRSWGCAFVVPINVTVAQGVFTKVDIHMYTGFG